MPLGYLPVPRRVLLPKYRLRVEKALLAHLAHLPAICLSWTNCSSCLKRTARWIWHSMLNTRREAQGKRYTRPSEPSSASDAGQPTIFARLVLSPRRNGRTTTTNGKMPFGPPNYPSLVLNGFALHPPVLSQSSCRACCLPETPT
jgi:hypothetical protein